MHICAPRLFYVKKANLTKSIFVNIDNMLLYVNIMYQLERIKSLSIVAL